MNIATLKSYKPLLYLKETQNNVIYETTYYGKKGIEQ